ncbi:MAG TPA: hypothetical protein VLQ48_09170 [Chloroflexia bacterium]|nr:hypothetical protein [Chloroflexia bacterium]
MRLDLETEIRYPDGRRAGILRRVILDPSGEVDRVVMATSHIISRDVIVPVGSLSEAPGNVLQIDLSDHDVSELPGYEEELEPAVPDGWTFDPEPIPGADVFPATLYQPIMPVTEGQNLGQGEIGLSQGTRVDCLDGSWGVVDEVLTGDDGMVTAFVGRPESSDEHDRLIPIELVSQFGIDAVTLNCTIEDLPTYAEELVNEAEEPESN